MPIHVVGGGVIGLLSAYELANAGCDVVVLEQGQAGQEASWAGGGILSPLYPWRYPDAVTQLAAWSQHEYPSLASTLSSTTGIDPEWVQSGMIVLGASDIDEAIKWSDKRAIGRIVQTGGAEVRALEPGLKVSEGGKVLWDPSVAQIRNPRLLKALSQWLKAAGVDIREQQRVVGFSADEGRLVALQTTEGAIQTAQCLVAAGAWTAELLATTQLRLPVRPVRGQMLLLEGRLGVISHIVMKDARYLIPRRDGRILVGSTLEEAGFDQSTTEGAQQDLLKSAIDLVPEIAHCKIERQWAGLRPGSPDGIPYIGEHPKVAGLFVCTGHYRNGIVLGPASARLVADLMLRRHTLWDPTPYSLKGF
jgi:glycine oxidase